MYRRHYLALTGSVGLAGCTGDPSGIISSDSNSSSGDSDTNSSSPIDSTRSPIETTYEGTGSSLIEITIENDGLTFFNIDTNEPISVSLVNTDAEDSLRLGVRYPSAFTKTAVHTTSTEYAIDVETSTEVSWSITVEDQPIYSEDNIENLDFPIEFSGESTTVFGPYSLSGFYQPRLRTNVETDLIFVSQRGETLHSLTSYGIYEEEEGSFEDLDPININDICWIQCTVNPIRLDDDEIADISYDVQIPEPDNS